MRRLTKILRDLLMVAGVFVSAFSIAPRPSFAQDSKTSEVALPSWLEKLNLSPAQQQQIRVIVREYDADVAAVWRQFSDRYQETIKTEAMLLAAIEDNLTEPQRKQLRDQRRKTAQREKSASETSVVSDKATTKPVSATEEAAIVGVSLTPEQEAAADKIHEKFLGRLRSLNRDIHGLHNRLVSLEADKIVEIEKILTKPQLQLLSESRQSASLSLSPAATATSGAKTK